MPPVAADLMTLDPLNQEHKAAVVRDYISQPRLSMFLLNSWSMWSHIALNYKSKTSVDDIFCKVEITNYSLSLLYVDRDFSCVD